MSQNKDYCCIFGGGGIRGVAYVGAIKAMQELGINIKSLAGSSVGAIIATLTALDYSYEELKEILMDVGLSLFSDINFDLKGYSFSKGEIFYNWIKELIEKKFYGSKYNKKTSSPVLFKDIDKDLIIMSVNLTNFEFHEFSRYTTPDFEIAKAVRASVSMPGLFQPIEENGQLIADGDLMKSCPMWKATERLCPKEHRILEFRLEDTHKNKKIDNLSSYLNAVYNTVTGFASNFVIDLYSKKDKYDYIKLETKNISVVDFTVSKDIKKEMINIGYFTTKNYFEQILPEKRKGLYLNYSSIYNSLLKIDSAFNKNDVSKINKELGELFMNLSEFEYYIDKDIKDRLVNFKNAFKASFHTTKIGIFEKSELKNKKVLYKTFNEVLSIIKEKVLELDNK